MTSAESRYVEDFESGYTRERKGEGWLYRNLRGRQVTSPRVIERLNAIALPPAYRDAWFCADPRGHIQATGIDDRGRLQYRYHPHFRARRDAEKYGRCAAFGMALPAIRKQVDRDLSRRGMGRDRVIAAVIHLLDHGKIRVGNRAYASANKSFGASTLRNRHALVRGEKVTVSFIGKSGKPHNVSIADRRFAAIVRRCLSEPGQDLFQYIDADGERRTVTSGDINDYLRTHSDGFTAKDFRTWGACVIAFGAAISTKGEIGLKQMLAEVAANLGNTPAIARKSYVHPAIIEAVQRRDGEQLNPKLPRSHKYLSGVERALIEFLTQYDASDD